ncbi:MAG TPA: hypothetical protein VFL13_07755 [Candidatus Baltobacteraceae bacterium]|nr:hypothetical protein [Candidatus Baltobacteraceae bacterium]
MIPQQARAVADAVLYEGFMLFPYTPDALKNHDRWQFGVLMPAGYLDLSEPSAMHAQLLCTGSTACIEVAARFLQVEESPQEREVPLHLTLSGRANTVPFRFGALHGRLHCESVQDGEYYRIALTLENLTRIPPTGERTEAIRGAFASAHLIASADGGAFVSLMDPPPEAKDAALRCRNRWVFPVLAGARERDERFSATVLASPIILYDYPEISAQSKGHTFDGTEIDELLMLTVASLTDKEKREARAGDPRVRALVDRAEASVLGERVRIHPKRSADAFDMFADGKTARVKGVHEDVDGRTYVAVVFDDDPASDLHEWYGRSFFYELDEVEPVS